MGRVFEAHQTVKQSHFRNPRKKVDQVDQVPCFYVLFKDSKLINLINLIISDLLGFSSGGRAEAARKTIRRK